MIQNTKTSFLAIVTTLIIVLTLFPMDSVQANSYNGYFLPWKYNVKTTLTQKPNASGHINQIDFVIGTTSLGLDARRTQYVTASKDGIIWFARDDSSTECNNYKGIKCPDSANIVVIKHPGNPVTYTWYYHLSKGSIPVQFKVQGTPVRHGEIIAQQGRTGNYYSTSNNGVHLHFFVSTGYSSPSSGKRLPSSSGIVAVTLKNGNSSYSYPGLTLNGTYTSYNSPEKWTQLSIGGYCLDLTDGINRDFTDLQVYTCGSLGSTNQKWALNILSPSVIRIKSSLNNQDNKPLCVDVKDGSILKPVQVYACANGNTNQTWQAIPVSDGYYQIKSKNFNVCLAPEALANRKQIKLKICNTSDTMQKWKMVELP